MTPATPMTPTTPVPPVPPPRLGSWVVRLTKLELRKLIVTRSTRTLLISMACIGVLLSAAVELSAVLGSGAPDADFSVALVVLTAPIAIGIPIIGVLVYTSDWQQREIMTMFLLEPRRPRVYLAKLVATVIAGFLVVAAAAVASLAVTALIATFTPAGFTLGDELGEPIASVLVYTFTGALFGAAVGAATLNSPLGIVVVTLQSLLIDNALAFVPGDTGSWLRSSAIPEWLAGSGDALHALTSGTLWLLVPFVIGFLRNARREPK
ncbi:hypothetical protein ACFOYW_08570 [Gryllotalpicola reticulitermitis]|uniref:ABC-2 type transport system permease protein n=1 Tax=Gryllotalpicola reticulitermitis TaxID=1184153 RepID=A0ABV8Q7J4_9MICO